MESGTKRRKTEHNGSGIRHKALIDFKSRDAAQVTTTSPFILKTDELLKQTRIDYKKTFQGVDEQLHKLKGIIDTIEPHDALPVRPLSLHRRTPPSVANNSLTRSLRPLSNSKRSIA